MAETPQFDPALKQLLLRQSGTPLGETLSDEKARSRVPVVAKLADPHEPVPGLGVVSRFGEVVTGRVELGELVQVRQHPNVVSLKASVVLAHDTDAGGLSTGLGEPDPEVGRPADPRGATGRGVIVAVAGWGFDIVHENFRNEDGSTRVRCLWDQRGDRQPLSPEPFGYGRELVRERIDAALATPDPYAALAYDPADVDRSGSGAHDTHVLDIAAGNGRALGSGPGMAPGAELMLVHLRGDDTAPDATLGDSVRLLDACRYLADRADGRPLVCNFSLGRTGGPHDASPLAVQAIDALLHETPGLVCVLSTGNYFNADLHSSGRVAQGGHVDLVWHVQPTGDEIAELEVWYGGTDTLAAELIEPGGRGVARVELGEDRVVRENARIVASVFHRRNDPGNGDNQIDIFLWPDAVLGAWTVRLHGANVDDGRFHAWIERDNPAFQSRFDSAQASPYATTGTIVNGRLAIGVGAYDGRDPAHPMAPFSSAGPTRDGREKPDVSAPGVGIWAARSSRPGRDGRDTAGLTLKSGTSMAAPWVAGVVARMLEVALPERLTAQEVREILLETAQRSPPFDELDRLRYGVGRVDAVAAVEAVRTRRAERARTALAAVGAPAGAAPIAANLIDATEEAAVDTTLGSGDIEEPRALGAMGDDLALRERLGALLPFLLVELGDRELRRVAEDGVPLYDKRQPLIFAATGRTYSRSAGELNYHAANFVLNTAYLAGYDVPHASGDAGYLNLDACFEALAGRGDEELRAYLVSYFDVVALPGDRFASGLAYGDLLLCGAEGAFPLGRLAIVAEPVLRDLADPHFARVDAPSGLGVQVLEAGDDLHGLADRFGRRLTLDDGRLVDTRMTVRLRPAAIDLTRVLARLDADDDYRALVERYLPELRAELRDASVEVEARSVSTEPLPGPAPEVAGLPDLQVGIDAHEADVTEEDAAFLESVLAATTLHAAEEGGEEAALGIAEEYRPGGRTYVPAGDATAFRCAPSPVAVAAATELPAPAANPDDVVRAALGALGVGAASLARFETRGGMTGLRPLAARFGGPALIELLRRLRYSAAELVSPPHTYDAAGLRRLGVADAAELLPARLLLAVPGHFRELARRAPTPQEAHAVECLGWLTMSSLRDDIATATRRRWWIPPRPAFVTAFSSTLPPLSEEARRAITGSLFVDTALTWSAYLERFRTWEAGPAGRMWRLETGVERAQAGRGRPFYREPFAIPTAVDIATERARVDQAWQARLAGTDARFAQLTDPSTESLRRCDNTQLPAGLIRNATLGGLALVYEFPVLEGVRPFAELRVLGTLQAVFEALFVAVAQLGQNDLLFQCAGAACFRGVKLPPDPNDRLRHHRAARRLSDHSYGIALDFNTFENRQRTAGSMDPRIVALFEAFLFRWGRCFPVSDPMHFEYCGAAC